MLTRTAVESLVGQAPKKKRRRRVQRATYCVGHLHDNLSDVAGYIQRLTVDGPQTVWAEDDGTVHAGGPDCFGELPLHWIAGTFELGVTLDSVIEDLRVLLRERSKDWIIEQPTAADAVRPLDADGVRAA